ncbi:hypothetical protein L1987_34335 [Smallanthus sonchifolius]|uniref:Uncharacterized protein n=1 Tax=Smallanthus sonchifolius TaxID=185202 RepID=A0ACB9HW40_9ASTR|nr:hypothetical protein L1987_34335 [Smallanthus sonchifolius]
MHISFRYVCLLCHKKTRSKHGSSRSTEEIKRNSSEVKKSQEIKIKAALQLASEYGSLVEPQKIDVSDTNDVENTGLERSRSLARLEAQKEFLKATSLAADTTFESEDSIHDLNEAFSKFLTMYPTYKSSEKIDQLRATEYAHLGDNDSKVCLDYCGFGLFSYLQVVQYWESCSITLSEITTNLRIHALYGGMETCTVEHDIKTRIMDYLKVPKNEYALVFTVSRVFPRQLSDSIDRLSQFSGTGDDENVPETHTGIQLPRLEGFVRAEAVTASLGFLTNFEDVYKLWVFVLKFLHPSFVREYGISTVGEDEES